MRWAFTAAAALLAVRAEAQPRGLAFTWTAPPECPSRTSVLRAVTEARGDEPGDRPLTVDVSVSRAGARWRATIRTRSDNTDGERAIEARSCARAAQGVALVVALAMDAEAPEASPAPPSPTAPVAPLAVLFVDDNELPPVLRPRRRVAPSAAATPVRFGVTARALVDSGFASSPSPGFGLGIRARVGAFEARVEAASIAPRRAEGPRPGAFTEFGAWFVDALACARVGRRFEAGVCAGAEVAFVTARAQGFTQSLSDASPAFGGVARVWFGVALTRTLTVSLEPEAVLPITRFRYEIAGVGVVHELPTVVFRGAISASVTWP